MGKADLHILIVEDDSTTASALEAHLQRLGFTVKKVQNAAQATQRMGLEDYAALIVDCMLPDKGGVSLSEEFRRNGFEGHIILTSGIYRDIAFEKDAMARTKAKAFFKKPFDVLDVGKAVEGLFAKSQHMVEDPLLTYLQNASLSNHDRIELLNSLPALHGSHLPLIYTMIHNSTLSGELEIKYADEQKAVVAYHRGRVCQVNFPDDKSYFGILLIEQGFASPEDVRISLASPNGKPIGQRMVDLSILSPHVVEVIQREQSLIRLSKTIRHVARVKFLSKEFEDSETILLEEPQFSNFLGDWIMSKLDGAWLSDFYTRYLDYGLTQGPEYNSLGSFKDHELLGPTVQFLEKASGKTIQSVIASGPDQDEILRGLHFLLLKKIFVLANAVKTEMNFEVHMQRLKKLESNFKGQSHFEVLGITSQAKSSEIQRAYQTLAKMLHPDKLSPTAPADVRQLTEKLFSRVNDAYRVLGSDQQRSKYKRTLEHGEAEEILAAESRFEEGLQLLETNRFRDARKTFEACLKMKGHRSETSLYLCWALLKEKREVPLLKAEKVIKLSKSYLSKIPHEDRHSPQYYYVRGLYYLLKQEYEKARSCFTSAYAIDHNFIEAARELKIMKSRLGKTKSVNLELSQVITKIFSGKKTG